MSAPPDPTLDMIMLSAQEAAKALRALGWPVMPCEDGEGDWRIRDAILTHDELVSFAIWVPNPTSDELTSPVSPQTHRDPSAPLDASEAVECIRAVMGVTIAPTVDEQAAAFRLIQAIIRKSPRTVED